VEGEGEGEPEVHFHQNEYYTPITTYPSDIGEVLPWEGTVEEMTLKHFTSHHAKLKQDLQQMDLPAERKQSLEVVLHSFENFIDVYKNLGPMTNTFIDMMRRHKQAVMGPDKWPKIEKRVSKEKAKSLFNFKEGPKKLMLKVQYFKHPNIAIHIYDRFLAAYGRFPWNDEVPYYFARFIYAEFFENMHPDYTDLPSKYYGVGKGQTYNQRGAFQDPSFPRPPPPLVSRPPRVVSLPSEMEATSQVGKDVRDAIEDNINSSLIGIDVGLNEKECDPVPVKYLFIRQMMR
jgi:hypothetical protein